MEQMLLIGVSALLLGFLTALFQTVYYDYRMRRRLCTASPQKSLVSGNRSQPDGRYKESIPTRELTRKERTNSEGESEV